VAEGFSERYGHLLTGWYDCVDRVVLNAYHPMGYRQGGLRTWWRQLHGGRDDQLDDTHLMRMAGRFRPPGEGVGGRRRPADLLQGRGAQVPDRRGVPQDALGRPWRVLILAAKAPDPVWKVKRPASGIITNLEKKSEYVNQYSFHIMDSQ
jgi:hypothetical protein